MQERETNREGMGTWGKGSMMYSNLPPNFQTGFEKSTPQPQVSPPYRDFLKPRKSATDRQLLTFFFSHSPPTVAAPSKESLRLYATVLILRLPNYITVLALLCTAQTYKPPRDGNSLQYYIPCLIYLLDQYVALSHLIHNNIYISSNSVSVQGTLNQYFGIQGDSSLLNSGPILPVSV